MKRPTITLKNTAVLLNDLAFFNTLRNSERTVRSKHNAKVNPEPIQFGVENQANGVAAKQKDQRTAALWN